jgi:hypothetical protein
LSNFPEELTAESRAVVVLEPLSGDCELVADGAVVLAVIASLNVMPSEPANSGLKLTRISLALDPRSLALVRWTDW